MKKPDPFLVSHDNAAALGLERVMRSSVEIEFEIPMTVFKAENAIEADAEWAEIKKEAARQLWTDMDRLMRRAYAIYLEEAKNKGIVPDWLYPNEEEGSDA